MRALLTVLALLVVVYWFGFFLFSCGTEKGTGVGDAAGSRGAGEVHFAG